MTSQVATRPKRSTQRDELFIDRFITNNGNAADAAEYAGFGKPYNRTGWRTLQRADIRRQIEARKESQRVQADYSIADWRRDLMADIEIARSAGSHSAVMKGRELLGRHIGALSDQSRLNREEATFFAGLGAAMQARYAEIAARSAAPELPAPTE